MKLQVSLIPALAYALVMMFSDLAGWKVEGTRPSPKQQLVVCTAAHRATSHSQSYVWVSGNGQLILSNGIKDANLEWKIPYHPVTNL